MKNHNLEVLSIMVVDDDRHMQSIVKSILSAMRIKNVRSYDTATDAFSELQQ